IKRPYVPNSGWPITYSDIERFYLIANEICEVGAFDYTVQGELPHRPAEMIPGFCSSEIDTRAIERFNPTTNFGRRFRSFLNKAANIQVLLFANCTGFTFNVNKSLINELRCQTFRPSHFSIRARTFVLAAGGLENTRLLLIANELDGAS